MCLRCAKADGVNDPNPYTCSPKTQTYQSSSVASSFEVDCSSQNEDACATHVCSCNTHFISSLFSLLFQNPPFQYDPSLLHSNGFNYSEQCAVSHEPGNGNGNGDSSPHEPQCCGYYPKRYHFDPDSASKACCNDHFFYNPLGQECCNGEYVAPIGTCY